MSSPIGTGREDLIGRKFGRFTVLKLGERKSNKVYWYCICDCGNCVTVAASSLKSGHSRSCGCLQKETLSLPKGHAARNNIYFKYRSRAKQMGLTFDLTLEQAIKIFESNCFYCGIEPKQINKIKTGTGSFVYNGIDRINGEIGYVIENCVAACGMCNVAKNDYSAKYFREWVYRIYHHMFAEQFDPDLCNNS